MLFSLHCVLISHSIPEPTARYQFHSCFLYSHSYVYHSPGSHFRNAVSISQGVCFGVHPPVWVYVLCCVIAVTGMFMAVPSRTHVCACSLSSQKQWMHGIAYIHACAVLLVSYPRFIQGSFFHHFIGLLCWWIEVSDICS